MVEQMYLADFQKYLSGSGLNLKMDVLKDGPGTIGISCLTLEQRAGDPILSLEPRQNHKGYQLEVIIYTDGSGNNFLPIAGGEGRAKMEYGNDHSRSVHALLEREEIPDLTLTPLGSGASAGRREEQRDRVHKRIQENGYRLYSFYTTKLNGRAAFVVHMPLDPYDAVKKVAGWTRELASLKTA
ncbi:MAG TPA: hypothetical protein VFF28_05545 [Candidatus Nanoarchaeia archaeon]|nr:hypothetical protein [Candidatus Nanoarchaeia archaeon]